MISSVLYLVVILSLPGMKDKIFSEPLTETVTLQQCVSRAQVVMPRIQQQTEYKGYDLKSFGCMTEEQLKRKFDDVRKQ